MTYTEKKRFEAVVTLTAKYTYPRPSFKGYGWDDMHIYKMEDADGNVLVWKTSGVLCKEVLTPINNEESFVDYEYPNKGAKISIKATVKGFGEYKGEQQVEITRVKLLEIVEQTLSWEEKQEIKKNSQLDSLKEGDAVWAITYKQYKTHYSDCETITGSYRVEDGKAMIDVIVRDGRMKESGTRFQHYSGYQFINENGETATYRAVSEDNAYRRCKKDFPEFKWTLNHVWDYDSRYHADMYVKEFGHTDEEDNSSSYDPDKDAWNAFNESMDAFEAL